MSLTWIPQHTPLSCTSPVGKFTCIIQSALVPTIQWNSRTLHLEVVLWIYLLGFHPWACTWWKLSHFQLLLRWSDTRYWYAWSKHETCCPWIMWSYPDCHTLAWLAYQYLLISPTNMCKYIASFVVCICAIYSASVLNRATTYCFFKLQVMAQAPTWKEYPEIECLCGCPAQSVSQKPLRIVFPHPLNVSQRCLVVPR